MINIILAGILGLPCLTVVVVTAPIIAILAIPSLLLLTFRKQIITGTRCDGDDQMQQRPPRHVIIVGGSSGIGLAIAKECARRNISKISILARNQKKLDHAKKEILANVSPSSSSPNATTPKISAISVSVTDYVALEKVAGSICIPEERTILFNCAGIPYTTEFDNIPIEKYSSLVETNQLGAMYVTRAFISRMSTGCIVFCSSAAGQVGTYGYTAYAPTKYAIRGFAETLHMELLKSKPGLSVQVAFPVDTDTPGYQEEQQMMPEITKILNANAGVADPDE
jgi:3-dehydrosphinganine reductase